MSLEIRNLSRSRELDQQAMAVIRGGAGIGSPSIDIDVPVTLNLTQTNNMVQNVAVLNNSLVGADLDLKVSPHQVGINAALSPSHLLAQLPFQRA